DDIELSRLYARPTANLCIGCKEDQERIETHIPYQKKSHTLGKTFNNKNVVKLPIKEELPGEGMGSDAVLKFNRQNIKH
ncbi:MAG: hypothetical protein HOM21_03000, partial [Halobacteriovoraceae bacterium]|nr:hypothetical protein [Halobacteriovoraceae bacterium]